MADEVREAAFGRFSCCTFPAAAAVALSHYEFVRLDVVETPARRRHGIRVHNASAPSF
jgi:hypothetical protein